ncbi:MAG: NAD-dependent epimerase/dehydratase family protein [Spirulina sp. SIO3F2]|nr:NAD-dependent epimerase/dehydratase family protein [Spirulina sp. SIO3F2]
MKALVTGANGFTGSHLVKALLARQIEVVALVRSLERAQRLMGLPIALVSGDIGDRAILDQAMTGVDWVFHTAAYVDLGIVDAERMAKVNIEGTRTVLAAAQAAAIQKLVYCSTIGIYGDTQGRTIDETFQREQQGFSSAYDSTKYAAQQLVDQAVAEGLPAVSVMPSGIFGPDDPHFGPVIRLFLQGKLPFWLGGDRVTGIVHVDDLVEAMILAAEQSAPGEHYILSTDDLPTREMFGILGRLAGQDVPREIPKALAYAVTAVLDPIGQLSGWNPPLSRERLHYIYDRCVRVTGEKARRELGWQPRDLETLFAELVAHHES